MPTKREHEVPRHGSVQKRANILSAARGLFLSDGYDRSSMDAVAARAGVSKRTVYDYFGNKQGLLSAIVDEAGESLLRSIRASSAEHLAVGTDLESALIAFARQIATDTFPSSHYAVLSRLYGTAARYLPPPGDHWLARGPEDAIAESFAVLARSGLLRAPNPRLAAEHFIALTFLLGLNNVVPGSEASACRVEQAIIDGVPAFLRAYAPPAAAR